MVIVFSSGLRRKVFGLFLYIYTHTHLYFHAGEVTASHYWCNQHTLIILKRHLNNSSGNAASEPEGRNSPALGPKSHLMLMKWWHVTRQECFLHNINVISRLDWIEVRNSGVVDLRSDVPVGQQRAHVHRGVPCMFFPLGLGLISFVLPCWVLTLSSLWNWVFFSHLKQRGCAGLIAKQAWQHQMD